MAKGLFLYSSHMKLADMMVEDPALLTITERLDIKLGFGDASVANICRRYGLSVDLFLMICNIYSFENFMPEVDVLSDDDIPQIIAYLRASHRYYSTACFPHLHESIHAMAELCDGSNRKVINKFYDDYDSEIANHFEYEETVVFPYIEMLDDKESRSNSCYSIEQFEQNHSNIDEKLSDLKNIILKYLPESSSSSVRYEVLTEIFRIEKDLSKHTLIENKLLIPLVSKLESNE